MESENCLLTVTWICIVFFFFAEGRRYGKTVIFAKNTQESSGDEDVDSESDGDDSNSDESMDEGHPSKKQKLSWFGHLYT